MNIRRQSAESAGMVSVPVNGIPNFYMDFKSMYQYNIETYAKRKIIRLDSKVIPDDIIVNGIAGLKIKSDKNIN